MVVHHIVTGTKRNITHKDHYSDWNLTKWHEKGSKSVSRGIGIE